MNIIMFIFVEIRFTDHGVNTKKNEKIKILTGKILRYKIKIYADSVFLVISTPDFI